MPFGSSRSRTFWNALHATTDADAKAVVEVYADFQCPACKQFEDQLGQTVEDLASQGKVKLVYHVKNFLDDNLRNAEAAERFGLPTIQGVILLHDAPDNCQQDPCAAAAESDSTPSMNDSARTGMSSTRSRRAGERIGKTLSR